jgi:hypothetical protein
MNEKIKALAKQAKITFTDYGSGEFFEENDIDTDRLEKFAELIVKECAQYVDDNFYTCGDALTDGQRLMKHFGVKE